jgi:hypothetical protein
MSMTLVSMVLASLVGATHTMTSLDEVMLSSVKAGIARTIEFSAIPVVVAGLSCARLWHFGVLDTSSTQAIAASFLVNMAYFRSHCDGSSELTCYGRRRRRHNPRPHTLC